MRIVSASFYLLVFCLFVYYCFLIYLFLLFLFLLYLLFIFNFFDPFIFALSVDLVADPGNYFIINSTENPVYISDLQSSTKYQVFLHVKNGTYGPLPAATDPTPVLMYLFSCLSFHVLASFMDFSKSDFFRYSFSALLDLLFSPKWTLLLPSSLSLPPSLPLPLPPFSPLFWS